VLEDGLAVDLDHGLGEIVGELAHAGAAAGGEEDGFVNGAHRLMIADLRLMIEKICAVRRPCGKLCGVSIWRAEVIEEG